MTYDEAQERAKALVMRYPALANDYRVGRAARLVAQGKVKSLGDGKFEVESNSRPGLKHYVDLNTKSCDCEDHDKGHTCMHRIGSFMIIMDQPSS